MGLDQRQTGPGGAALRRAEAMPAVNAGRAGERLADNLVPRVGGRIWPPGAVIGRSEDGDDRGANGRGNMHDTAIVGDHEPAETDERAQRLGTRRR